MKKLRLLSMSLVLVLLLLPYVGEQKVYAATADYLEDGDIVIFGSYPQTLVMDGTTCDELDQEPKTWEKYPYYSKNTSPRVSQVSSLNYSLMEYADFYHGNDHYRAVRILKFRPKDTVNSEPGTAQYSMQDDHGYTTNMVYYFKYEPIRWYVLDKANGILISEKVLDSQPFNASYTNANGKLTNTINSNAKPSHYYYSTLRLWLNAIYENYTAYGDFNFINMAFSSSERSVLKSRQITFTDGSVQMTASDKVFLLSKAELENYRNSSGNPVNVPSVPTDYSEAQGYSGEEGWWLSDSNTNSFTEAFYAYRGADLPYGNSHFVGMTLIGVRPVIKVNLSSSAVVAYPKLVLNEQTDDTSPVLKWDSYPGATKYVIERNQSTDPDQLGGWSVQKELSSSTLTYTDTGTLPENSYHYRLRVETSRGKLYSAPVRFDYKLPVPVILVDADDDSGKPYIRVEVVPYADEYTIWRGYNGSWTTFFSYNNVVEGDYFRYEDQTAVIGEEYGYEARANSGKNRIYNSDISIKRYVKCVPAKVTSVKKTDYSNGMPKLSWTAVSGVKGYRIQYKTYSASTWNEAYTKNSYYVFSDLEPGKTYQYRVYASLSETDKTFDSAPATGSFTSASLPEFVTQPQDVVAFAGGSEVTLKVFADGTGVTYDWYVMRDGYEDVGFVKEHSCTNGEWKYKPSKLDDGATYYVLAKDQFGRTTTSITRYFVILSQPANKSARPGTVAEFTATTCIPNQISSYQWQSRKNSSSNWANSGQPGAKTATLKVNVDSGLNGWQFRCVVKDAAGNEAISGTAVLTLEKSLLSASAKYSSITKNATQEFTVVTTSDVKNLMLYAEGGSPLVKSWPAAGNSTVSGNTRTWNVSQAIGTAGDRKLVFKVGTTNTIPVTNAVTVPFKVENTGVISASVKNATIKKGGEQVFTVKTTSDAKYLVEYAEDGKTKVKTWTADSSNSSVSGNVRTWTVKQNIATAGNRNLIFKAGTTTTPTSAQRTAAFTVEDVWVNSASVKYATIGKGGTQTFTVKTTSTAQNLMLYAEGGNLVKTWPASGNSTVSGDVRTWTVKLAIGTAGNRELTFKAGKTTTPSPFGKSVKFTVAERKILSAKAKYTAITKASMQGFTVTTTTDVKYLMLYAEGGNLVKSWAASGNSTVAETNIRTWNVIQEIGTTGDRKLVFKGGTTNTTPVTNASTVSFKVVASGVLTASAKNATMNKGTTQTFTVTTTADCNYLAEYAESGNLVTTWTANSSNSKVSGNVRTWTVTQTIGTAGKRTLMFKAGKGSTVTAAERSVSFTVK